MMARLSCFLLWVLLAACSDGRDAPDSQQGSTPLNGNTAEVASDSDGRPLTIPALREWRSEAGQFHLREGARIVIASEALRGVAEVLAEDIQTMFGGQIPIVTGTQTSLGDILLSLGEADPRLGDEGYRLTVAEVVSISSSAPNGVFYGTRSLLQMLNQSLVIKAGEALDWPRYPERGMMIDVGRKFFTADWIKRHIKEMAWLKLNLYHFHFSENEGFRVESESHPEIVSEEHLTKDEVREIVALAARYFITVVPEIGMPGHMGAALAPHPEYQIKDILGQPSANNLDVTNPEALQFARELIEEYLPLFPGPWWHTGGDEYLPSYQYALYPQLEAYAKEQYGANAVAKDAVHGHINWAADLVAAHGKQTRAWNDDLNGGRAVTLNPNILVEWWTDFQPLGDILLIPTPQQLLDSGHRILNASNWPTYLTPGGPSMFQLPPDMPTAYESWDVHQFSGAAYTGPVHLPYKTVAADEPRNRGTKFHFWANDEFGTLGSEDEIAIDIAPRLRVIAQKAWQSPPISGGYAGFQAVTQATGHAPGY
ncbi:MAG: family 20 glycosylhydrolase [Nevskiales bacterium]